jgi:hypothetical protein
VSSREAGSLGGSGDRQKGPFCFFVFFRMGIAKGQPSRVGCDQTIALNLSLMEPGALYS